MYKLDAQNLVKSTIFKDLNELKGELYELSVVNSENSFKNKTVLDIGCGKGNFLILCSLTKAPKKCIGLDPAEGKGGKENILKIFRENVNNLGINNIQIIKEDIFNYRKEKSSTKSKPGNEKFDLITLNFSLHHIIDTKRNLLKDKKNGLKLLRLFRKIYDLLKDEGELFIKEVSKYNISKYLKIYGKVVNLDNINWNSKHQPYEYTNFLKMAKFKEIRVRYAIPYKIANYTRNKLTVLFANRIANFFFSSTYYIIAKK